MKDRSTIRKRFRYIVYSSYVVLLAVGLAVWHADLNHLAGWYKRISTEATQGYEVWRSNRQDHAVGNVVTGKVARSCMRDAPKSDYADTPAPRPSNPVDFRPTPSVDDRGFIDVWQLRQDLSVIEPLWATDTSHLCRLEAEPKGGNEAVIEDQREQVTKRVELAQVREGACRDNVRKKIEDYKQLRDAFNAAWMPVLLDAVRKGDSVAEVILLNCDTSPVIDRSQMPSTCTDRNAAVRRLKAIGFAPAVPPAFCSDYGCGPPYGSSTLTMQNQVLDAFRNGSYIAVPHAALLDAPEDGTNDLKYKVARNRALIWAATQDVDRAFVFGPSEYVNEKVPYHARLSVNRSPVSPTFLSWGPELILAGELNQQYHWRSRPYSPDLCKAGYIPGTQFCRSVFFGRGPQIDPKVKMPHLDPERWIVAPDFETELKRLLQTSQESIATALKSEPRWGVFLLNRIGHHEWLPERMTSTKGQIDNSWIGKWKLVRHYVEFVPLSQVIGAVARIETDGSMTRISIQSSDEQATPLRYVVNCTLRYSGGVTPLGHAPFGKQNYIGKNGNRTIEDPARNSPCGGVNGLDPLDPNTRYRQVLMQCDGAEALRDDSVRFLLRNGDTLIEVASEGPVDKQVHIRHFNRIRD
ncbi:MAG: hypothetical protein IPH39_00520 [Sulfuritalea sp.]|jgi:hypothetical protein|nr:hypothetical protein [Sulfuritalea sp.]MBK9349301.1 hypothetical protein [Sulfuritalea sp.]